MTTGEIRSTGVRPGRLGFGAASIGNLYREVDDATAAAAVDRAWESGLRYFDTAPHYGLGLSERRLGAALAGRPRDELVVSTKVGRLLLPHEHPIPVDDEGFAVPGDQRRVRDYSRDGVLRSIEASLRRTGLDRIDVVYIHDPDDHWTEAIEGAVPTLVELREQGVIGAVGAGMNQSAMLARFLRETDVDVVMLAGRYTLLEQGGLDDVLPAALEGGRAVVAVGVFNSGLLSRDRPEADAKYNYEQAPGGLVERANALADVCERHGTTLPVAAVAFPFGHPSVMNVTVGMRSPEQVDRNVGLAACAVPAALWDELKELGLLRLDATTPS